MSENAHYSVCAYCNQHLNLDHTSYDVLETEDGKELYVHHYSCCRLYVMNHQLGETHVRVVKEVLHVP